MTPADSRNYPTSARDTEAQLANSIESPGNTPIRSTALSISERRQRTWRCWCLRRCGSTLASCHHLRSDGDREALRILLCARQELTTAATAQANRLRALLRDGGDADRVVARSRLSDATLAGLARRRQPRGVSRAVVLCGSEIRRLALALRAAARTLQANPRTVG